MVIFKTVAGNSAPDRAITLQHNGGPINLSGATVTLIITNAQTGAVTNAGAVCTVVSPAADGNVNFAMVATDCPAEGRYFGEFKIVYPLSKSERLHNYALFVARAATT